MNLLVTGSSSGIGRALVERLIESGHQVWGIARSDQAEFQARNAKVFRANPCDISRWDDVVQAAAAVAAAWSHLDGLVACAGLQGEIGRTLTAEPGGWDATIRANLLGTFHTLRAFHTLLERAPRRAKIVCLSGGGATKPRANFSAYGVAKTGIVRLVETIAEEEKGRPLDINAVAPGAINTRLTDEVIARGPGVVGAAEYHSAIQQKETGGASVAKALDLVEWLLSPASDGISGRLLSAPWDPWERLTGHRDDLASTDIYTLRRIGPGDRGRSF